MEEEPFYKRYIKGTWYTSSVPIGWILVYIIPDDIDVHYVYQLIDNWLVNNSNGRWCGQCIDDSVKLYVENESDAVLFKLTCL